MSSGWPGDPVNVPTTIVGGRTYRLAAPADAAGAAGGRRGAGERQHQLGPAPAAAQPRSRGHAAACPPEPLDEALVETDAATGALATTISCDEPLFEYVDVRRQEIEEESGASIEFVRGGGSGAAGDRVVVRAAAREPLAHARRAVEALLDGALRGRRLDFTHFVSLPLATPANADALARFRADALADAAAAEAAGLDESVFADARQLHMTVQMLKLCSADARAAAQQLLLDLAPRVRELLGGRPLRVRLRGLSVMRGPRAPDPSEAHVVYLAVADEEGEAAAGEAPSGGRLMQLCRLLSSEFRAAGLAPGDGDREPLPHATVINTRHRRGGRRLPNGQRMREPVDARALLARHGALDLGVVDVAAVHVSERRRYDERGYYHCCQALALD